MSRSAVLVSSLATASAFMAPASSSRRAVSSLKMEVGQTAPLGFFDPLGLSKDLSADELKRYRECEIKHGRLAMLAVVGILVGEEVEFGTPLYGDKIVGPAIYQFQEADQITGFGFAGFIVGLIAVLESYGIRKTWETPEEVAARDPREAARAQLKSDYISGDWGFDPLGIRPKDSAAFDEMQTKEINNGRLAMIGAAGMLLQEIANGKGILENLGLESALPKAFDTGAF